MAEAGEHQAGRAAGVMILARDWALDGAERQLCYLAGGIDRSRYLPTVVLDRDGAVAAYLRERGVDVHVTRMRDWRRSMAFLWRYGDAAKVVDIARERDVRVVHASDPWKGPYALHVARKLGLPAVVHVRGPMSARKARLHGVTRADAVITIAERYRAGMVKAGAPADRVHVVDDAVDLTRFAAGGAGAQGFRGRFGLGGRVAVGMVGRIEPFKRVVEFMSAAAVVEERLPGRAVFVLVGQEGPAGYMREVRGAVERLGLSRQVIFTGRMEDMPATLGGLDVLATFSGGSVMFEAMACGRPVVSVRADGLHSVHTRHDETAWCVTTEDPRVAGEALARVAGDAALRTRLGEAGRAWVARELSPERMVRGTEGVYEAVLRGMGARRR